MMKLPFFGDASFADFLIAFLFRICLEPGLRMGARTPRMTIVIGLLQRQVIQTRRISEGLLQ